MPSLWGKEFLIFLNLLRYGAILFLVVWCCVRLVRLMEKGKSDDTRSTHKHKKE